MLSRPPLPATKHLWMQALRCVCALFVLSVVATGNTSCQARQARLKAIGELRAMGVINKPDDIHSARLPYGATLLINAVEQGDTTLTARLLTAGADPDGCAYSLRAVPLTRALHPQMVKLLIDAGADVDAVDAVGTTPLSHAAALGNRESVRLLLQAGADPTPAAPATPPLVDVNNVGMAGMLIQAGASVNQASGTGTTPLMRAAARGNVPLAELYLGAGADVNAADAAGNTALHVARTVPMVELLVAQGAAPAALNARGETALFEIMHSAEMVQALLTAGVPHNIVSKERKLTALQVMLSDPREDAEAILTLIRAGADATVRTPDGRTTVQLAAARGGRKCWDIIRALIRAGACPN